MFHPRIVTLIVALMATLTPFFVANVFAKDEKEAFASLAHDALDVQRQGEARKSGGLNMYIYNIYILIYTCMYVYIIIFYTSIIDSYIHYIFILYIYILHKCHYMKIATRCLLVLQWDHANCFHFALAKLGEALASLQWRYLEVINRHDCDASLPDINGDRWDGRSRTDCGSTKCRLMHHIRNI
jgi:hypothetical protein